MTHAGPPRHGRSERPAGRVVPVFAVTGGRTRSSGHDLPVESLVTVVDPAARTADLQKEYRLIVELAARPVSLVEIGAHLRVPVGVARVLVSDLAESGHLAVHAPLPAGANGSPTAEVLTRLLEGLRAR